MGASGRAFVFVCFLSALHVAALRIGGGKGSGSGSGAGGSGSDQTYWLPPAFGSASPALAGGPAPGTMPLAAGGPPSTPSPQFNPNYAGANPGNPMTSNVASMNSNVAQPYGQATLQPQGNPMAGFHPPSYAPPGVPPTPSSPYTSAYSVQPGAYYSFLQMQQNQMAFYAHQAHVYNHYMMQQAMQQAYMPHRLMNGPLAGFTIRESAYRGQPKKE